MGKRKARLEEAPKEELDVPARNGEPEALVVEDKEIGPECKPGFRWEHLSYHLTYKGHVDQEGLVKHAENELGKLMGWSIVHESSDKDQPYDHTHFFFRLFAKPLRRGNVMDFEGVHPHVRKVLKPKHAEAVYKYHLKAPVKVQQEGEAEVVAATRGAGNKKVWQDIHALVKEGKLEEIKESFPGHYLRSRSAIIAECRENAPELPPLEKLFNVWVFGEPNTGKSTWARKFLKEQFPNDKVYVKDARTKWWDGITAEHRCVIIEDPDRQDFERAGFWKRLFDKFPVPVETKGGSANIRPKCIIVTSNYAPEDCFAAVDLVAMYARLVVRKATKVYSEKKEFDEEMVVRCDEHSGFEKHQADPTAFVSQSVWDGESSRNERLGKFLQSQ